MRVCTLSLAGLDHELLAAHGRQVRTLYVCCTHHHALQLTAFLLDVVCVRMRRQQPQHMLYS
jgi:hypothetical protein